MHFFTDRVLELSYLGSNLIPIGLNRSKTCLVQNKGSLLYTKSLRAVAPCPFLCRHIVAGFLGFTLIVMPYKVSKLEAQKLTLSNSYL
jgi:hypothetical protein